jgi:hypothetical protein
MNNTCFSSADCHSTQVCTSGQCAEMCPTTSGQTLSFGGDGDNHGNALPFQTVGLHEVGHLIGLDHPLESDQCGAAPCDLNADCPNGTLCSGPDGNCGPIQTTLGGILCPVMSSGIGDAHYPNRHDTDAVRRGRTLSISQADITSPARTLSTPVVSCTFEGLTYVAPKVACRPNRSPGNECVVSWRQSPNANASFSFIDTPSSSACQVLNTMVAPRWANTPVDVAWGAGSLVIGVGARPADGTRPNELELFRVNETGTINDAPLVADALNLDPATRSIVSFTEPKISYNEPRNRYVIAYTDQNSNVKLISVDQNGELKDSSGVILNPVDSGYDSYLSPEIACDTHSSDTFPTCILYIAPSSNAPAIKLGGVIRLVVVVSPTGALTVSTNPLVTKESQERFPIMVDAGTYGEFRQSTQPNEAAFWMNSATLPVQSDADMLFSYDPTEFYQTSTTATFVNNVAFGTSGFRPNASGMDWNEWTFRFLIATARD